MEQVLGGIYNIKWEIKDGKLISISSDQSLIFTFSYSFSNNDRTLTLISPDGNLDSYKKIGGNIGFKEE